MSSLTSTDRDSVIRTIYGEARNQATAGMTAVAFVIKNRVLDHRWPDTADAVVKQKFQFSTWNENDPNKAKIEALQKTDHFYIEIGHIVDAVFGSLVPDPTNGAVYYYSRFIKAPSWWKVAVAESKGFVQVGDHLFAGKVQATKPAPKVVATPVVVEPVVEPVKPTKARKVVAVANTEDESTETE